MLLNLYLTFFKIGLFSFGGGYATLPIIQQEVVTFNSWLSLSEFNDLITISQMTPGPIAINSATFVGTRMAGLSIHIQCPIFSKTCHNFYDLNSWN